MCDPVETITTANVFVESTSSILGAQVVDPHDAIPDVIPREILLTLEILYGLSTFDPPHTRT